MHVYAQNINEFKITATDADSSDFFGCAVSLDGDYAIIGACRDDSAKGSAYIFKRDGIQIKTFRQ